MNEHIDFYREKLNLKNAEFMRVDHEDTMIATVYRVRIPGNEPLILKVCSRTEDYHRELYFLRCLETTLPVPRIEQVVEPTPGIKEAILMECLPGRLLQESDWSDSLAYEIGSALAHLHLNLTEGFGDLTNPQKLRKDPGAYFGEKFEEELAECNNHLGRAFIENCRSFYERNRGFLANVDGPCMVHRDFRPGNLLVDEGKLRGIIDWAGGRSGFAEQDFCSMVHNKWPSLPSHKKALLKGYSSVRPIPDYHVIMPLLQLGRALAVIGFTVKSDTWDGDNANIYKYNRTYLENFNFLS